MDGPPPAASGSSGPSLKRQFAHLEEPQYLTRSDSLSSLSGRLKHDLDLTLSAPATPQPDSELEEGEGQESGRRVKRARVDPDEGRAIQVAEDDAEAQEDEGLNTRFKHKRRRSSLESVGEAKPGWWFKDAKELEKRRDAFLRAHASLFLSVLPSSKSNHVTKLLPKGAKTSADGEAQYVVAQPYKLLSQPKAIAGGQEGVMKDYQLTGLSFLAYMADNGCSCILADEMGLGKTLQTLSLLAYLDETHGAKGPHLLICPLSVLDSWMKEIKRWLPSFTAIRFHGPAAERQRLKGDFLAKAPNLLVTTYEAFVAEQVFFKSRKWGVLALDEGHKIKNSESNVSIAVQGLGAKMRVILSGTPLQNNLVELWALLHFLFPAVFTPATLKPFKDSFNLSVGSYDQAFIAKSRKLLEVIMLRRTKEGVSGQLSVPPREELTLYVPLAPLQSFWYQRLLSRADTVTLAEVFGSTASLDEAQLKLAKEQVEKAQGKNKGPAVARLVRLEKELAARKKSMSARAGAEGNAVAGSSKEGSPSDEGEGDRLAMGNAKFAMEAGESEQGGNQWQKLQNLLIQLRKCCNHPFTLPGSEPEPFEINEGIVAASGKLVLLDKLLKEILPKGEKILIFSGSTKMLDILEDFMSLREYKYSRLDGSTSRPRRALDIRLFQQSNSDIPIFLISTRAGGLGINLTAATNVVLYDQDWNPQTDVQAVARAHRIQQTKKVKVYRFVTQDSVEDQMLSRIRKKLYLSAKIMDSMRNATEGGTDATNELDQTADEEAPKMSRGELAAILRGGTGALAARWETEGGGSTDAFTAFRAATFSDICERGRKRDENKDVAIKLDLGEEVSEEELERRRKEEEEAERLLLEGREAVQSRKFGGKLYTASNADIRKEWEETVALEAREKTTRTVMVGGHAVLKETIGNEQWGAVKTITSDPKMAEKLASPKRTKRKFEHEDYCHNCKDGGELFTCVGCPRVWHAGECCGRSAKELKQTPMFWCPQHNCHGCGRNTQEAGGMLFRCQLCPSAFCEDCFSEQGDDEVEAVGDVLPEFLLLDYGKRQQAYFIRCTDCVAHFKEHPDEAKAWKKEQDEIEQRARDEGYAW
ncbi:hypothetical protein JCM10213_004524 [Rhodosporidiobolus nylandii]